MSGKTQTNIMRYITIVAILLVICAVFCARLASLQIIDPLPLTPSADEKTYTRTVTITAVRGEIYDTNGKALVTNDYTRAVVYDWGDFPWTQRETNELVLNTEKLVCDTSGEDALAKIEYFPFESIFGTPAYKESYATGEDSFRLTRMLSRYELSENTSAEGFVSYLMSRWGLVDGKGVYVYSEQDTLLIFSRRYDMAYKQFGPEQQYVLCEDADVALICAVLEQNARGITTRIESERHYEYPGYLSHVLGRVGKIPESELESYVALGYPMDAVVGLDGVELAFESYLHGTDGILGITEDKDGNVVSTEVIKEPVAGKDVRLTIDIELQIVAEDSLAYRVQKVAADGLAAGGDMSGADADAGAIVALDPRTNAVLCIASYPTFDLSQFDSIYCSTVPSTPHMLPVLPSSSQRVLRRSVRESLTRIRRYRTRAFIPITATTARIVGYTICTARRTETSTSSELSKIHATISTSR